MSGRRAVLLGLLCGMTAAVVLGAAVVALGPDVVSAPTPPPSPLPTPALVSSPGASASAVASPVGSGSSASSGGSLAGPSGEPGASASAGASGSPGESASAGASAAPGSSATPGGSGAPAASPAPSASGATSAPTPSLSSLFRIGTAAPPLRVAQLGGGVVDLAALRGHPVWLDFMATWCPSCQEEFPLMNGFAARYAADGLVVVAVDVREDEGTVGRFANRMSAALPIGLDSDGSAARRWGAVGLPVHFFIDSSGVIRDAALGGVGADLLAASLRRILPGVDVTP